MSYARNYDELSRIKPRDGLEVAVISSGFVYRSLLGRWVFLRRLGHPFSTEASQQD